MQIMPDDYFLLQQRFDQLQEALKTILW